VAALVVHSLTELAERIEEAWNQDRA
jgi:hypothetical protein